MKRAFNFSLIEIRQAKKMLGESKGEGPPADLEKEQSRGLCIPPALSPNSTPVRALSQQSSSQQGSAASSLQAII